MSAPKRQCVEPVTTITIPSILTFGGGCSSQLKGVLKQLGLTRPMIVTDDFIATKSGLLQPLLDSLDGLDVTVFGGCVPDPTTDSVAAGLAVWRAAASRPDVLVGIGGGSSIDSAKAIALLAVAPEDARMRDYKVPSVPPLGLPVVAIPTTAGTGSEVTKVTIITDAQSSEKMLIMGYGLLPKAALVDHTLTHSMPFRLTADSGLDALCHAMEAYVSRKANFFSDQHALTAMRLIPRALRAACRDLSDVPAREALMLSATHAGIAFSNASVTLIHGMSRPIGAFFHVPHGLSNAMLLPLVTAFSLPGARTRYAECSRAMGFADASDDDAAAGELLLSGLSALCRDLRVPSPHAHGIGAKEYQGLAETMAQQALASGSPNNNPLVPTAAQIVALYTAAFKGDEVKADVHEIGCEGAEGTLTDAASPA